MDRWYLHSPSELGVSALYKQLQLTFPNTANKVSNQAKFKLPFDTKQHIVLETAHCAVNSFETKTLAMLSIVSISTIIGKGKF